MWSSRLQSNRKTTNNRTFIDKFFLQPSYLAQFPIYVQEAVKQHFSLSLSKGQVKFFINLYFDLAGDKEFIQYFNNFMRRRTTHRYLIFKCRNGVDSLKQKNLVFAKRIH